jgi:hypothetical protein
MCFRSNKPVTKLIFFSTKQGHFNAFFHHLVLITLLSLFFLLLSNTLKTSLFSFSLFLS